MQKDTFIQFGKIPGVEEAYSKLEDEGFMIDHTHQGILGFVP